MTPRAEPVDERADTDQHDTRAEDAGAQHRAELEQAQAELVLELRPDRGQPEVDERDGGLRGGRPGEDGAGSPRAVDPSPARLSLARGSGGGRTRRAARAGRQRRSPSSESARRRSATRSPRSSLEEEGARVDAAAFAELWAPTRSSLVRAALGELADDVEREEARRTCSGRSSYVTFDDEPPSRRRTRSRGWSAEIEESLPRPARRSSGTSPRSTVRPCPRCTEHGTAPGPVGAGAPGGGRRRRRDHRGRRARARDGGASDAGRVPRRRPGRVRRLRRAARPDPAAGRPFVPGGDRRVARAGAPGPAGAGSGR